MTAYFPFLDKLKTIFLLAAFLCLFWSAGFSATEGTGSSAPSLQSAPSGQPASAEWRILAQHYERTEERLFASGNVEAHYGDLVLFADRLEIMVKTKDVRAEGNVVLQYPNEVVKAESLTFNPDTSRGLLDKAQGMVQPSMLFQAERLERIDPEKYVLYKAGFTSCSQPVPRWQFTCSKATLKKNDFIEMWNSVFKIKGIPVFYLPYMRYPLERRTGFLMPQPDYTANKGFEVNQDFYWAMARNMDATLKLSYYSKKGYGLGLDTRYLFADGTAGNLMLRSFFFKKDESGQQPKSAFIIRGRHNQMLPFGFSLVGEADYSSSFDFLREFDNDFNQATVSNRRTQLYLSKAWPQFSFSARVSRFETHFPDTGRSILTTYLPQLSFNSFKIKLFQPLYFSFSSSFSRWQYGWDNEFDQGTEKRLQSLSFSPFLSLPFSSIPWLTVNAALGANLNYYWQRLVPNLLAPGGEMTTVNEPFFSRNFVLSLDLVGPVFFRVFPGKDGSARVKHIIEPSVSYRYESPTTEADMIVTSHGFFRYHQVVYGLTNHVLVKEERLPREWFTFGLAQAFYLSPQESPLGNYRVNGRAPRFSEISSYLRFFPAARFSLDFAAGYNPYHQTFSSLRLGASLGSPAENFFLTVNWFKSISVWLDEPWWDRHQINVAGTLKVPGLSLEAQAEANFNLLQKELQHLAFQVLYDYQCLVIKAGFMYFQYRSEIVPILRVTVGDIGNSGDFLGNPRL
jgi:LPS-assembly protein